MRKVALIITAALTLAILSRLPAVPLDADGRVAAAVSINPHELMLQATDLPVQVIEDLSTIY